MRFIGDVHGKFGRYTNIAAHSENSIQVGDMGCGFNNRADHELNDFFERNPQHRFIRGNHDSPMACKRSRGYIADGHVDGDIMFVGGAWSIDRQYRTEGISWWADEELSHGDLNTITDKYIVTKPKIMVTHDCPEDVALGLFLNGDKSDRFRTRTGQALQNMFEQHQPKLWVFGHWHQTKDVTINGTRFICLGELEYMDIGGIGNE